MIVGHGKSVRRARRRFWLGALVVAWLFLPATLLAAPLQKLPLGEQWYSIRMQDDLVGFVHVVINPAKDGYEIVVESGAKMVVLGFTREAMSRERYLVAADFTLKSFAVEQTIDRSPLNFSGRVTAKEISATVTTGGDSKEQRIAVKGKVYPPPLVNFYPLLFNGVVAGKKYTMQMLDPEGLKIKSVTITAVGPETVAGTAGYHFRNDLYPFVANDVWVDAAGNTLRESVRQGLIETVAEPAAQVRLALLSAAVAKKDLVLDFSLIRLAKPLERPQQLSRLIVELDGYPESVPLIQGPGQVTERVSTERVRFIREHGDGRDLPLPQTAELLRSTARIPADDPGLVRQVKDVLGNEKEPRRVVEKLVLWVAEDVKDAVTDGQSALDTLQSHTGNCVSHARLFVAMARAAGLPSRMAVGLVYAPGKGFLYHAWAEVYIGTWLVVDPTFNQVPADLTHLKLAEGETPDDFAVLAGLVGNVKARVIETVYGEKR